MSLSAQEIQKILPHRWPFLLVDRIEELEPGVRATGLKNVSINEPFFQGHFPGNPIMPGDVLRLEVRLSRIRGSIGKGVAKAEVDGTTVAEGELTFALVDIEEPGAD